jgi:hypothetical protein
MNDLEKFEILEELNKGELISLMIEYDRYIVEFYESHDNGDIPVCLMEFYHNDFQEIIRMFENGS